LSDGGVTILVHGYGSFHSDKAADIVPALPQQRGGFRPDDEHPIVLLNKILSLAHLHGIQADALSFVRQFRQPGRVCAGDAAFRQAPECGVIHQAQSGFRSVMRGATLGDPLRVR
jgi:hypothetical protein